MKITNEKLAELKARHPKIHVVHLQPPSGEEFSMAFRPIDTPAYTRWKIHGSHTQTGGPAAGRALEFLARDLIVYPEGVEGQNLLTQLVTDAPAIVDEIAMQWPEEALGGMRITLGNP